MDKQQLCQNIEDVLVEAREVAEIVKDGSGLIWKAGKLKDKLPVVKKVVDVLEQTQKHLECPIAG